MESELLTPAQAARTLARPVCPASIWRWTRYGILARNGERIKLPHKRVGARLFIERAALAAFEAQLDASAEEHFDRKANPARSKRAAERAAASEQLDRRGVTPRPRTLRRNVATAVN